MEEDTSNAAKTKKAAPKKKEESKEFKLSSWNGVKLELDKKFWILRSRSEIPGLTALDVAENPVEAFETTFIGWETKEDILTFEPPKDKLVSYAFDSGKRRSYLAIVLEDREDYIHPGTPAGKKAAEAIAKEWHERRLSLIKAARHKDDKVCEEAAASADSLIELWTMAVALGGSDKDLLRAGKSRKKKIDAIMKLRPAYFEKKAKGPIPERESSKSVNGKK